ncbi:MAG TPA: YetF domain-containing protein [Actinomycetota bacterium]
MQPMSWFDSLFTMPIPIGEKIARTVLVYLVVVILLRLLGRRTVAQLNAFDLVVLLLISNVVQNAIIGPDNSFIGGVIGVVTLLLLNTVVVWGVRRHERLDGWVEGKTVRLVHDGEVDRDAIKHLGIREADLRVAMLNQGAEGFHDVQQADMYPSGAIVVDLAETARDASKLDLERVERKIDDLQAAIARLTPSS